MTEVALVFPCWLLGSDQGQRLHSRHVFLEPGAAQDDEVTGLLLCRDPEPRNQATLVEHRAITDEALQKGMRVLEEVV